MPSGAVFQQPARHGFVLAVHTVSFLRIAATYKIVAHIARQEHEHPSKRCYVTLAV